MSRGLIILIVCTLSRVQLVAAMNVYCASGEVVDVQLGNDADSISEIKIFPYQRGRKGEMLKCQWNIRILGMSANALVSGFDTNERASKKVWKQIRKLRSIVKSSSKLQYQLKRSIKDESSCGSLADEGVHSVDTEVYDVIQISEGDLLTVTYQQAEGTSDSEPPTGLMIQLVKKDFCTRDTVNLESICYRISTKRRTLLDELSATNNLVHLASFQTPGKLHKFVESSKLGIVGSIDSMRSKVPLNLSQPVRIGLFYNNQNGSIEYLQTAEGKCLLTESQDWNFSALNITDMSTNSGRACGSLRVDQVSGSGIIEFRNCNESLPALVSFSENPQSTDCGNCSEAVVRAFMEAIVVESYSIYMVIMVLLLTVMILNLLWLLFLLKARLCIRKQNTGKTSENKTANDTGDKKMEHGTNPGLLRVKKDASMDSGVHSTKTSNSILTCDNRSGSSGSSKYSQSSHDHTCPAVHMELEPCISIASTPSLNGGVSRLSSRSDEDPMLHFSHKLLSSDLTQQIPIDLIRT